MRHQEVGNHHVGWCVFVPLDALVTVTGCYAQTGLNDLRTIQGIDLIVGNQDKMRIPDLMETFRAQVKQADPSIVHTRRIDHENFVLDGTGEYSTTRANLKIQDGCQFMCSFCLIPFARGRERSRRLDDAVREAESLAERGHRELVLTGVNLGQYQDGGEDLLDLIRRLEEIPGIQRLRISSIEPTTIPHALIEYMATSEKLCRYLHIPLQSGDNGILQSMNRRYSVQQYADFLHRCADSIQGLCLGTDVMVGYPGEGEKAFANTRAVIEDLPFAYLHVFSFSKRPGTAAARRNDEVPGRTIKARSRELAELSRVKRLVFYQRHVGHTVRVLFESSGASGLWTGLTDNYIRVGVSSSRDLANSLQSVRLTGVMDGLAVGSFVEDEGNQRKKELPFVPIPFQEA
jgi:threonylcarbamoyladenosine tRNA methylthiotransferase MtaB